MRTCDDGLPRAMMFGQAFTAAALVPRMPSHVLCSYYTTPATACLPYTSAPVNADADSLRGLLCGGLWAAVGDVGSAAVRQAAVELVGACVGACGGATVAAAMGGEGGQRLR